MGKQIRGGMNTVPTTVLLGKVVRKQERLGEVMEGSVRLARQIDRNGVLYCRNQQGSGVLEEWT
jgi:hypothetical protein